MSHFPHGAIIAAHAAEEQRRNELEEEEMTAYKQDELDKDWEFKIVRSGSGAFRNPNTFQALMAEESIGGWELVEKLDDRRVRFKRRRELRRKDEMLPPGYDPYRTQFGGDVQRIALFFGLGVALLVGVGVFLLMAQTSDSAGADTWPVVATVIPLVLIVFVAIRFIASRR